MLQIDVVAETACESATESEWWTRVVDPSALLRLYDGMTEAEIAAVVIAVARQNQISTDGDFVSICSALLKDDILILSGGIRVREQGKEILPGCCCGIEDWREQAGAFLGKEHWLGHDPAPWVEVTKDDVLIWSDGGIGGMKSAFSIKIEKQKAERISGDIQRDLKAFLGRLYDWAERSVGPILASKLVTRLDNHWVISGD